MSSRFKKIIDKFRKHKLGKQEKRINYTVLLILYFFLFFFTLPNFEIIQKISLKEGQIASNDIIAPFSFDVIKSEEDFHAESILARNSISPTYKFSKDISKSNVKSFDLFFKDLLKTYKVLPDSIKNSDKIATSLKGIFDKYGINISESSISIILSIGIEKFKNIVISIADDITTMGYIKDFSDSEKYTGSRFINIDGIGDKLKGNIVTQNNINYFIVNNLSSEYRNDLNFIKALYEVLIPIIKYNLSFEQEKTIEDIDDVTSKVSKFKGTVLKGEKIIGVHERVTKDIADKLNSMNAYLTNINYKNPEKYKKIYYNIGKTLLIILILYLTYTYIIIEFKHILHKCKYLYLLYTLLVISVAPFYIIKNVLTSPVFVIPVSFLAVMVTILIERRFARFVIAMFSVYVGFLLKFDFWAMFFVFFTGILSVHPLMNVKRRSDILNGFIYILLINLCVGIVSNLLHFTSLQEFLKIIFISIFNAFLCGVGVLGFLPVFERIFNISTNITLIDLSDSNLPLLRDLTLKAPGTDMHSRMVSFLAEKAARAIGGNELLARVGALYHDIGKTLKPEYFIENQAGIRNPHDKLSPYMSALIIQSHVREGIELAKKHKIPAEIIEIIQQHHGTDLIKYFYEEAKKLDGEDIDEQKFRYPGPKPQTKEAGIIMLADAVESATRSLQEPTASRIKNMTKKVVKNKFVSGELDESELSMRDLTTIEDSFVPLLTAFYHSRIPYPEKEEKK